MEVPGGGSGTARVGGDWTPLAGKAKLLAAHDRRAAENSGIVGRPVCFPRGAPPWPDWGRPRCGGGEPLRALVLFSGLHSELEALLSLDLDVEEILWVELDHRVAAVGEATFRAACERYGARGMRHTRVAEDVLELTREVLATLGRVHVLFASFPCQAVASVNTRGRGWRTGAAPASSSR